MSFAAIVVFIAFLLMFAAGVGRNIVLAVLATAFVSECARADCVPFNTADARAYIEANTSYRAPDGAIPPAVMEGRDDTLAMMAGNRVYGLFFAVDGSISISSATPENERNAIWVHELVHWYQWHSGELATRPKELVEMKAYAIQGMFARETADANLCPIEFEYPLE